MKFERYPPNARLRHYIKYYAVSENEQQSGYTVFPSDGLVIGFQYKGKLAVMADSMEVPLDTAGITGISDRYKIFKNSPGVGSILVYLTATGLAHFTTCPANELLNLSVSLGNIFEKDVIESVEEQLNLAETDLHRVAIVEQFFLSHLKHTTADELIEEAVKLIYQAKGSLSIGVLGQRLSISQSPLEKRFRKTVGTSPKKFASIVRFNAVLQSLNQSKSLTAICYDHHFFDQAHFIKDFKQFTGITPEGFRRLKELSQS